MALHHSLQTERQERGDRRGEVNLNGEKLLLLTLKMEEGGHKKWGDP